MTHGRKLIRFVAAFFLMIPSALLAQAPIVRHIFSTASADSRLAPGSLATISGANLALPNEEDGFLSYEFPTVLVGGRPARILGSPNSDPKTVLMQLPVELTAGPTTLVVTTSAGTSAPLDITLEQFAPALFNGVRIERLGVAASAGCYSRVRGPGDVVTVFASGLGATNPLVATGTPAPDEPLALTLVKPEVTVGGRAAEVLESALAPGEDRIGQYQVTFRIPPGSGLLGVVVSVGGVRSNSVPVAVGTTYATSNFLTVGAATWFPGPTSAESLAIAYSCYPSVLSNAGLQGLAGDPRNPPVMLAGVSVGVQDSLGVQRPAPLLYVSSAQVNYLIPAGTANGAAKVTITSTSGAVSSAGLDVQTVAPGIFQGALLVRSRNGNVTTEALSLRISVAGGVAGDEGAPILDLGPETDEVRLILFGTGLRFRTADASVSATFGGTAIPVEYAGPQPEFAGLDQLNLKMPKPLAGLRGPLTLTVDGNVANLAYLTFK